MMGKGWLQLHPLVGILLSFIAGILLGDVLRVSRLVVLVVGAVAALSFFLSWWFRDRRLVDACCQVLLMISIGSFTMLLSRYRTTHVQIPSERITCEGIVVSEPVARGKVLQMDMMVVQPFRHPMKLRASLLRDTINHDWQKIQAGDGLVFSSVWEVPSPSSRPYGFDQLRWLRAHGYAAQAFVWYEDWDFKPVSHTRLSLLQRLQLKLLNFRHELIGRLRKSSLSDESKGLVAAMSLGDRSAVSRDTRETFNATGAAHVLALSGLHLSIIYSLLMFLFWHFRHGKVGLLVVLPVIWLYVMLVGMPVSAVRAAVMLTVCGLCTLLDRKAVSLNSLSFSALLLLFFNPMSLWDVSFQLSFVSVSSILVFYPTFYRWLRIRRLSWLSSMLAVSLAAQLGTVSLLLHYFGRFSTYFLVTNLLVVPAAFLILVCSVVFFLTMPFSLLAVVGNYALRLLEWVVQLLHALLAAISSWPCSTVNVWFSTTAVFLSYACMALGCLLFRNLRQGFRQGRLLRMR